MTSIPSSAPTLKSAPPLRLDHLDGLRAVTALYVILFHLWQYQSRFVIPLPPAAWWAVYWLAYGRSAVGIFIVLSGYCLMLPVARSGELRGGPKGFFGRRARRILPPYYAALLIIQILHLLRHHAWLPLTGGVFLSHLFLVHNWSPRWEYQLDVPMWSVAVEWQIYFFFPLLLLPLWRRFGIGAAVAAAFAVGLSPHFLLNRFDETSPWYLGLFALGAASAVAAHSPKSGPPRLRRGVPWGVISGLLGLAFVAAVIWSQSRGGRFDPDTSKLGGAWPTDVIVGLATACLLIHGAQKGAHGSAVIRFLSLRWLVTIGTFSYSLYLTHDPVLQTVNDAVLRLHLRPLPAFGLMVTLGVGAALVVSYMFHLAFERPFLVRRRNGAPAEVARDTALSPAP